MLGTTTTLTTPDYYSAGRLMEATQLPVPRIRELLAERGIRPAFFFDGIDYYNEPALTILRALLQEQNR